jgi:hypothetical protein
MMTPRARDLCILGVLALAWNALIAAWIDQPGYTDAYYYFNGGVFLARGDGLWEPYLWNYINAPPALPVPAFGYWRPLASFVAAGGILALPWLQPFDAAQAPFVLLGAGLPLVSYIVTEKTLGDRWLSWVAGLMTVLGGFFAPYWSLTETFTPFALAGAVVLLCVGMARVSDGRRYRWLLWAVAGACAALADLTRADGLLLLATAGLFALFHQRRWEALGALLLAYVLMISPWFARNLATYGSIQPPGGLSALWLLDYNDLFNYPSDLSAANFLSAGIGEILRVRWVAFQGNLGTVAAVLHLVFLFPFGVIGFWLRRKDALIAPALVYGLGLFGAMTLLFPLPGVRGGLFHSGGALLPFVFAGSLVGLRWTVSRLRRWNQRQAMQVFSAACVVYAALVTGYVLFQKLPAWNESRAVYRQIGAELEALGVEPDALVMSNSPPDMYTMTGRGGVPLPNGDEAVLLRAARDYGVRYLVIDIDVPEELTTLYEEGPTSEALQPLAHFGDVALYEITLP